MRFCSYCGKEIADEAFLCLNCGCKTSNRSYSTLPSQPEPKIVVNDPESSLATWSKICGIVSFFIGWFALGITAVIMACMSKEDTGGKMNSSAQTGFVCGLVSTILWIVFSIVLIVSFT